VNSAVAWINESDGNEGDEHNVVGLFDRLGPALGAAQIGYS
jgi:hypothetical protein